MNYIHLGCGYRLHRLDSMNWELEHWHASNGSNNPALNTGKEKWHRCGRYYQSLSAALAAVYELALREDDGASVDLEQALDRADGIKRELLDATADLRKVE